MDIVNDILVVLQRRRGRPLTRHEIFRALDHAFFRKGAQETVEATWAEWNPPPPPPRPEWLDNEDEDDIPF